MQIEKSPLLPASKIEVTRLAGELGAEIKGIDLKSVTAADAHTIKALLHEHLVLFFPNQNLEVEQHVELGRHFGPLDAHPNLNPGVA